MTIAAALVQRLADILTGVAAAAARGFEDLLDAAAPRPQAQLVPVRVRQNRPGRRG